MSAFCENKKSENNVANQIIMKTKRNKTGYTCIDSSRFNKFIIFNLCVEKNTFIQEIKHKN